MTIVRMATILVTLAAMAGPAAGAEVSFGEGHEMIVDGKLFLPVHAWAGAMKDLDRLKGHGVNVVLGLADASMAWKPVSEQTLDGMKTYLDELHKRNMYGAIIISSWWSDPAKRGVLKDKPLADYVNRFKDHPALLGWQVSTEDDMGLGRAERARQGIESWAAKPNATAADIVARCREVKKLDPAHPVIVMFSGGQMIAADRKFGWTVPTPEAFYTEVSAAADILYQDIFPVANNTAEDLKEVYDATRLLEKYSEGRKHLWVAVDAGDRKRWSTKSHAPTGAEIRNELWQAIVAGAHGLGFDYTSWKPDWASIRMSEEGEKGLTAAVHEIESLKEPILRGRADESVKLTSTGEGRVDALVRRHGGKLYLFAVNLDPKPATAAFDLPGVGAASARVIGEDRTVAVDKAKLTDPFDAYAVHLYEIDPGK